MTTVSSPSDTTAAVTSLVTDLSNDDPVGAGRGSYSTWPKQSLLPSCGSSSTIPRQLLSFAVRFFPRSSGPTER